jgi:tetratricopeptide (TPR) repeat protein
MDRFLDRGPFIHIMILVVLGIMAYINAIGHPFVHDDVVFILQNPNIQRWDNIADAFFCPSIPQFFQGMVTPYYRPVLEILYRLEYQIFGFNPQGFHFFNILIHLLNGLLVYSLIKRLTLKPVMALALAGIFLVHPVQTEAVACISGISNLACALLMLMSIESYLRCLEGVGWKKILWQFLSVFMFIAALFTKEQAVILPMICLFYEWISRKDHKISAMLGRWLCLLLVLMAYFYVRHTLFGGFTTAIFENIGEFKLRMFSLARLLEMYLGLLVFPTGLHYYRSLDILGANAFSWIVLGAILSMLVYWLRQLQEDDRKIACFGLGWFIIALMPVLNIIPLVNEYSYVAAAEHNLYFPMVGFLFLAGIGYRQLTSQAKFLAPEVLKRGVVILIAGLTMMSLFQNQSWRGEVPLFLRATQFEPQLGRVHILLAKAYFQQGQFDQAIGQYSKAETIMNAYVHKASTPKAVRFYQGMLKGIYSDSAQAYANKTYWSQSIDLYSKAIALDPKDSFLFSNRALSIIASGNLSGGISELQKAISLNPDNLLAANNLSICWIQKGEFQKARVLLEDILSRDPGFTAARDNLNKLMMTEGRGR